MSDDKKNKRGARGEKRPPDTPADRDVGHALRSVYSSTVNEEIPTELIDLLGKLS